MDIPLVWAKASADCRTRDDRTLQIAVWGSGENEETARRDAASRVERLIERIRRGDPFPERYAYGSRPLREEILENFDGEASGALQRFRTTFRVYRTAGGFRAIAIDQLFDPEGREAQEIMSHTETRELIALPDRLARATEPLPLA